MTTSVDPSYFARLKEQYPGSSKPGIRLWRIAYTLDPEKQTITRVPSTGARDQATSQFDLFVVHCLLNPDASALSHDWVSEKDLPGGAAFFRGPHLLPTEKITRVFGNDLKAFTNACSSLDGTPLAMADAGFCLPISPTIQAAVLYWAGDDDFPPEAKLLFDRSISRFPLDIVYCLAVEICSRIAAAEH